MNSQQGSKEVRADTEGFTRAVLVVRCLRWKLYHCCELRVGLAMRDWRQEGNHHAIEDTSP